MTRARAVFFDAGNTLFTERSTRASIYRDVGKRHGVDATEAEIVKAMKESHAALPLRVGRGFRYSRPWFERFIGEVFKRVDAPDPPIGLVHELFATFARADTFKVYRDVPPALTALAAKGIKLGVISNWAPSLTSLLEELGLAQHFSFVLASALEELEKPDPAIFRRALGIAGLRADEVLHVGDQIERDIEGARNAGIRGVLVDREGNAAGFEGQKIATLTDLVEILQ